MQLVDVYQVLILAQMELLDLLMKWREEKKYINWHLSVCSPDFGPCAGGAPKQAQRDLVQCPRAAGG